MNRTRAITAAALPAAALMGLLALGALTFGGLAAAPPPEVEMAGYVTSLAGRTAGQRHNARLAANGLDGRVIAPGDTFSFNRAVRSWSADRGYVKAPVSYDGELVRAFGGGVCQTSTTLYNAALLAGLDVVERHHHVFAPRYVAPGRDAAVAYPSIDLRLRNPYPWPIRLRAAVRGDRLEVRVFGREQPTAAPQITTQVLAVIQPARMARMAAASGAARSYARCPGLPGYRVITWRVAAPPGREPVRERLSDDSYPALDRIVQVTSDDAAQP